MIREKEPPPPSTRFATLKGDKLTTTAKRRSTDTQKLQRQLKGDLDWIVMKCLEKDRQRRYESANALAADLRNHITDEPVTARSPSRIYRFQKGWRRNRLAWTAGLVTMLALVVGIVLSLTALARERDALHAMVSAEQRGAGDRVRFAILSGDDRRTEQALKEAGEKGLPGAKLKFLRGLHLLTSAQPLLAVPELKAARELEPDNVAALGLLATASVSAFGWAEYERLIPDLEKARPTTPDDYLFLGQALSIAKSEAGIPLMEQAVRDGDSPMARIILGRARTSAAMQTGSLSLMDLALTDIAAAEAWSRHSLPVLIASSQAHRVAAGIHGRANNADLAKSHTDAADQDSERLEAFHPNLQALHARLEHLVLSGAPDKALEKARKWSREIPGSNLERFSVWVLMMQGNFRSVLELTRQMSDDPIMQMARFLAAIDAPDTRAEADLVWQEVSTRPPAKIEELFAAVSMNLLQGRTQQARGIAAEFLKRKSGSFEALLMPSILLRTVKFLAGEISEESFLKAAQGTTSMCMSHHFVGLSHLAAGDRMLARKHFQSSRDTGADGDTAHGISVFFLKRLNEIPNWPLTIPVR
jgi:hypothetical protein